MSSEETERIYTLARLGSAAAGTESLVEAISGIRAGQWERLMADAKRHCIAPLIYKNLSEKGRAVSLPEKTLIDLRGEAGAAAANNMLLLEYHNRIASAAAAAGIALLPLKGAYLIGEFYGPEERPMTDLDYLAAPGDGTAAGKILLGLGFESERGKRLTGRFEEAFAGEDKFRLRAAGTLVSVEIHRSLLPTVPLRAAFPIDENSFLKHALRENAARPVPRAEHALLFGAVHLAAVHLFSRMIWLSDIDRILRRARIDWDFLLEETRRARAQRVMFHVLRAASRFFSSPVPESACDTLSHSRGFITDSKIDGWLAAGENFRKKAFLPALLALNPASFIAADLFPPPEFIRLRYDIPSWKVPAFYLARPFMLALASLSGGKRDKT